MSNGLAAWVEAQTDGLPACRRCGQALSVPDEPERADGVPVHHYWSESQGCDDEQWS